MWITYVSACLCFQNHRRVQHKDENQTPPVLNPSPSAFRAQSPAHPTTTRGFWSFCLSASRPDLSKAWKKKDILPPPLNAPTSFPRTNLFSRQLVVRLPIPFRGDSIVYRWDWMLFLSPKDIRTHSRSVHLPSGLFSLQQHHVGSFAPSKVPWPRHSLSCLLPHKGREGVARVCAQALQGLHSGMVARTHIAPISGISCPGSRPRKPSPTWREESGEAAWPSNSPCVCASKTTYPTALHPRGGSLLHFLSLRAILTGSPWAQGQLNTLSEDWKWQFF